MLDRIYLEITNMCNMNCSFCHKTKRKMKLMPKEEFDLILDKITGKAKSLYFHLMGEPTMHPYLSEYISLAREKGFVTAVTTNGSLLKAQGEKLLSARPFKVSVSLHAPEANPAFSSPDYLENCVSFAKKAAGSGCFVALRLWNLGTEADNSHILEYLHKSFPEEWHDQRGGKSQRISDRIFLEWGEHFEWPDPNLPECDPEADRFCHALRDQIGILVDGTVVPCCLDADGNLALGNIFESSLEEILSSPHARAMYDGFTKRRAVEPLCRKCGYAERFSKK